MTRKKTIHILCSVAIVAAACVPQKDDLARSSVQVDALFAPFTAGVQPGAAVMVIHDGKVVHQAGYGYANLETRTPIGADTAFRLASVSKQFTVMAVMILAEDGKLEYDDPISRYLPQLAPYEGVTIRHLLTHTGGLPEYYDIIETSAGMPSNADALELLGKMGDAEFVPGERYEYSNPGYDMLASLVAAASGIDFAKFMQQRIFVPLGMTGSLVHDHTRPAVRNRSIGYEPEGEGYKLNNDDPLNGIVGSGGVYTTLHDLFRWDQALYGESLVSSAALDEAFTPALLNKGESTHYGFGWRIEDYSGHRRIRHGGSWVGFRTHIARYPDDHFTVVMLSNRADFNPEQYVDPITDVYLDISER